MPVQGARTLRVGGLLLMVAFQRRFDPAFAALQRDIAGGAIGRPQVRRILSRDSMLPPESIHSAVRRHLHGHDRP
jgi:predicted dehydrogenase